MNDNASSSKPSSKSSGDGFFGLLFRKWFIAFVIPGVVLLLIRNYYAEQERQKQQQARDNEFRKMLQESDKLGPALKMLLGIEPQDQVVGPERNPEIPLGEARDEKHPAANDAKKLPD